MFDLWSLIFDLYSWISFQIKCAQGSLHGWKPVEIETEVWSLIFDLRSLPNGSDYYWNSFLYGSCQGTIASWLWITVFPSRKNSGYGSSWLSNYRQLIFFAEDARVPNDAHLWRVSDRPHGLLRLPSNGMVTEGYCSLGYSNGRITVAMDTVACGYNDYHRMVREYGSLWVQYEVWKHWKNCYWSFWIRLRQGRI